MDLLVKGNVCVCGEVGEGRNVVLVPELQLSITTRCFKRGVKWGQFLSSVTLSSYVGHQLGDLPGLNVVTPGHYRGHPGHYKDC